MVSLLNRGARSSSRTGDSIRPQSRFSNRWVAAISAFALAAAVAIVAPSAAYADDYPTWDELQAAKADTAAAENKVDEIQGLIAQLAVNVAETQAQAEARGNELQVAQQKFDDAERRASDLATQAQESAEKSAEASKQAGQLAAQLYRSGSTEINVDLFLDAGNETQTDELLAKLGTMDKLTERTSEIYETAETAKNTASALGAQADVAKTEREKLRVAAEEALAAAQEAQAAAEAALAESENKKVELEAQVAYLQDAEATTAAEYQKGVEERARIERERLAAEAARIAAERAAAAEAIASGQVTNGGWARPASGWITGSYGPRDSICSSGGCSNSFHYAIDIGTGCDAPIYAASSGRVVYAGYYGTYGNFVQIDHGGGVYTGYAHIRPGGILVGYGQYVGAGEQIAWSGTTGASTGCHLHYEVYNGAGNRINPIPWMADRGIYW